jgi:hypothetical protein
LNPVPASPPTTIEDTPRESGRWKEFRWWLVSASVFTIVAAICVAFLRPLTAWGGFTVLIALGTLPFVAEACIQFRNWFRRILWIIAGGVTSIFIVRFFPSLFNPLSAIFIDWPAWIRGPVIFLLPACLEFLAALSQRNRPWAWLIVTPALFGLAEYWIGLIARIAENAMSLVTTSIPFANGLGSEFYFGAAIFGTVLFTRALTGSLVASRRHP